MKALVTVSQGQEKIRNTQYSLLSDSARFSRLRLPPCRLIVQTNNRSSFGFCLIAPIFQLLNGSEASSSLSVLCVYLVSGDGQWMKYELILWFSHLCLWYIDGKETVWKGRVPRSDSGRRTKNVIHLQEASKEASSRQWQTNHTYAFFLVLINNNWRGRVWVHHCC